MILYVHTASEYFLTTPSRATLGADAPSEPKGER